MSTPIDPSVMPTGSDKPEVSTKVHNNTITDLTKVGVMSHRQEEQARILDAFGKSCFLVLDAYVMNAATKSADSEIEYVPDTEVACQMVSAMASLSTLDGQFQREFFEDLLIRMASAVQEISQAEYEQVAGYLFEAIVNIARSHGGDWNTPFQIEKPSTLVEECMKRFMATRMAEKRETRVSLDLTGSEKSIATRADDSSSNNSPKTPKNKKKYNNLGVVGELLEELRQCKLLAADEFEDVKGKLKSRVMRELTQMTPPAKAPRKNSPSPPHRKTDQVNIPTKFEEASMGSRAQSIKEFRADSMDFEMWRVGVESFLDAHRRFIGNTTAELDWIVTKLQEGNPRRVLEKLTKVHPEITRKEALDALEREFGCHTIASGVLKPLSEMKQGPNQSIQEFLYDIEMVGKTILREHPNLVDQQTVNHEKCLAIFSGSKSNAIARELQDRIIRAGLTQMDFKSFKLVAGDLSNELESEKTEGKTALVRKLGLAPPPPGTNHVSSRARRDTAEIECGWMKQFGVCKGRGSFCNFRHEGVNKVEGFKKRCGMLARGQICPRGKDCIFSHSNSFPRQ